MLITVFYFVRYLYLKSEDNTPKARRICSTQRPLIEADTGDSRNGTAELFHTTPQHNNV